ncbi:hypothetical protein FGO68_gene5402 [Halteria grandinella]|uniref:RING-type E3 ubiquitin transferase n=1 Tax=Halteria grandinella TaxID=5974 RepID=A0A8J8SZD1_HALGN|nr:hypothetical protein FGO68_gene5402 [Halteria grandinella]
MEQSKKRKLSEITNPTSESHQTKRLQTKPVGGSRLQEITNCLQADKQDGETCPICLCDLDTDVVQLGTCKHLFHRDCLEAQLGESDWLKCCVCQCIYGLMKGDMPPGEMKWRLLPTLRCEGYPDIGVWDVFYNFWDGTLKGVKYKGTKRRAYLPDCEEGKKVLALLIKAFERRITFSVGTSVTTGQKNVVVWNIHHKTSLDGGPSNYGYPDEEYFKRVQEELAQRGVVIESEDEVSKTITNSVGHRYFLI